MNDDNHLGLFAKHWTPGKVKTRLAVSLGDERASRVHFELLRHLVAELRHSAAQRWLVFDPLSQKTEFEQLGEQLGERLGGGCWNCCAQSAGHLGERMRSFFQDRFAAEKKVGQSVTTRKTVVIGSDCPQIDRSQIDGAFSLLDEVPVVIGPSLDGGYCLIGMRQPDAGLLAEIFEEISWSTSRVLAQTIVVLEKWKMEYALLPEMNDVDDADDLAGLLQALRDRVVGRGAAESDRLLLSRLEAINES